MAGIFKSYDIRGIYGDSLTDDVAFKIGRALATFLKCRKAVVGRDMRPHSAPLFHALAKGLTMQGADVIDLGLCSTPMSYYANGLLGGDAGVMITASHNTGEWNGLKLSRKQAVPISGDTGIAELEKIVTNETFDPPAKQTGCISHYDVIPEYTLHVKKLSHIKRPVKIAVDFANSMGIYEAKALEGLLSIDPLFDKLDGTFPNHEANPLKTETLAALQKKVRDGKYDFGVAFDGDADRAGFVDEKGEIIPMDMVTAIIAQDLLKKEKSAIFYDLRSSWAVKEVILENGGTPMMSRVGHSFIKQQMRENNAMFAGELSGHYYFRENFYTESSSMATICIANIASSTNKPISELVKPIQRYFASGEMNFTVTDAKAVIEGLKAKYGNGKVSTLDGLSVEFSNWWFNVRASNTEPLIRLNLEAKTKPVMEKMRDEIAAQIK